MAFTIPHRRSHGMCPVNGIRDLVQWRAGRDWSNQFLYGLGLGGGFAYMRFKNADPPRQVYWGNAGPRQHKYLAELLHADFEAIENRSFEFSWEKAKECVDKGKPPIIGPLDMYYLHFHRETYRRRHIPIHYLLLVGYDDRNAYVHDTDEDAIQTIPLIELELAWNVNVPGMGRRNRLAVMDIPKKLDPTEELIRYSIQLECQIMLSPQLSMIGVPAMERVGREIAHWPKEFGQETANRCLQQVLEFLNFPPDLDGKHMTAGRDIYISFLEEAGELMGLSFYEAINRLRNSMEIIPELGEAIREGKLDDASICFYRIAEEETEAYIELKKSIELED